MKRIISWIIRRFLIRVSHSDPAGMAELVDALDSKSSEGNFMGVRFPLPAPDFQINLFKLIFFNLTKTHCLSTQ
jgi:hypothetical protein